MGWFAQRPDSAQEVTQKAPLPAVAVQSARRQHQRVGGIATAGGFFSSLLEIPNAVFITSLGFPAYTRNRVYIPPLFCGNVLLPAPLALQVPFEIQFSV